MEQAVWLVLGTFALLTTFGAVAVQSLPKVVAQLGIAFAMLMWFYWAIAAGNVTVTTNCCVQNYEYTGAMLLGTGAGLINGLLLVDSVWGLIGVSRQEVQEVTP